MNNPRLVASLLVLMTTFSCNTSVTTLPGGSGDVQFLNGQWTALFDDGHTDCLTFSSGQLVDVRSGCKGDNTLLSSQPASRVGDLITFIISGIATDGTTTQTTASLRVINENLLSGSILRVKADGTQTVLTVTFSRN